MRHDHLYWAFVTTWQLPDHYHSAKHGEGFVYGNYKSITTQPNEGPNLNKC